ncbi:MAG: hypothetical protein V4628_01090 [Pseudomonadota bacterium]
MTSNNLMHHVFRFINYYILSLTILLVSIVTPLSSVNAATITSGTLKVTPNTLNTNIVRKANELVTMGVPLTGCTLIDPKKFRLFNENKVQVAVFVKPTLYWPATRDNCGVKSIRALKVQFVFDATKGIKGYSWDLGGRTTTDRAEALVSEIVTNNSTKGGRKEPRVFGILDPAYLVQTGITPPSTAITADVYDTAFFPIQWSKTSSTFSYNSSTVSEWLFDRVSTNYKQAMRRGDLAYYREAYLSHEWYISQMEVTGKNTTVVDYCLGGFDFGGKASTYGSGGGGCDTKYIYLEAYKLHLALTGDDSWLPKENGIPSASGNMATRDKAWRTIAHMLVLGDVRGGVTHDQPAIPQAGFIKPYTSLSTMFTERDLGFGLQNLVNACELTLDATICGWADTVTNNIRQMQIANPDGIKQYGYLSHSLRMHEGDFMPWVGNLIAAYSASKTIKVKNVLGQGHLDLTTGKTIRIGSSLNVKLAGNAIKNSDGTWTLPLATAVTASAGAKVTAIYLPSSTTMDLTHDTDRIFSPWMQAIAADAVWQYHNWTDNSAQKTKAAAILLGFGRAYAAYALDGTHLKASTKALIEAAFDDYGPIKVFNTNITLMSCTSIPDAPFTRYFSNALMSAADMNREYAVHVFQTGGYANQHTPEGVFQVALGLLFETDADKKAAMQAAITDMRMWFKHYSCPTNITNPKRLYSWSHKGDPFGTYAYVVNKLGL